MVVHINSDEMESIDLGPAFSLGLLVAVVVYYLPNIMATFGL